MEHALEIEMAKMFRDATMQSVVLELRNPDDWDRFNEILTDAKKAEDDEVADYDENKDQRIAEATKELIDKAGAFTFEHPTPIGTDQLNKAKINRQAKIKVENDHQATLLGIIERQNDGFEELTRDIRAREGKRDYVREAFSRSNDRRSGEDRRAPSRNR